MALLQLLAIQRGNIVYSNACCPARLPKIRASAQQQTSDNAQVTVAILQQNEPVLLVILAACKCNRTHQAHEAQMLKTQNPLTQPLPPSVNRPGPWCCDTSG